MTAATPSPDAAPTSTAEPPRVVVLAGRLLYAMAGLQLVIGGVGVSNARTVPEEIRLAVSGFGDETTAILAEATLAAILAALMVLCAIFVLRGRQWARVVAYLVVMIQLCAGLALGAQEYFGLLLDGVDMATYEAWRDRNGPVVVVGMIGAVLMVVAPIGLVVMLSTRTAHAYFRVRRQTAEWTPPTFRAT